MMYEVTLSLRPRKIRRLAPKDQIWKSIQSPISWAFGLLRFSEHNDKDAVFKTRLKHLVQKVLGKALA